MILWIFRLLCQIASKLTRNNTTLNLVLKTMSYKMNLEWVIMGLSNLFLMEKKNQTKQLKLWFSILNDNMK